MSNQILCSATLDFLTSTDTSFLLNKYGKKTFLGACYIWRLIRFQVLRRRVHDYTETAIANDADGLEYAPYAFKTNNWLTS